MSHIFHFIEFTVTVYSLFIRVRCSTRCFVFSPLKKQFLCYWTSSRQQYITFFSMKPVLNIWYIEYMLVFVRFSSIYDRRNKIIKKVVQKKPPSLVTKQISLSLRHHVVPFYSIQYLSRKAFGRGWQPSLLLYVRIPKLFSLSSKKL